MNGPTEELPSGLVWRALLLLLLISAAGAWASAHLGWPLKWSGPVFIAIGFGGTAVDWLLGKRALEQARATMRRWTAQRLTWPVVLVPACVFVLGAACLSSVAVRPGSTETGAVRVAPALRALSGEDSIARFLVLTMPWGRDFAVEADGYGAGTFRGYPVVPRTVRLERDLAPTASVLFRPGVDGLMLLGSGAVLNVWTVSGTGERRILASDSSAAQTSFLLGPARSIPDSMSGRWRSELERDLDAQAADRILRAWRSPTRLAPRDEPPAPDGRLIAEIVLNGTVISRGEVRLSAARLIDVPMVEVLPNPGGVP